MSKMQDDALLGGTVPDNSGKGAPVDADEVARVSELAASTRASGLSVEEAARNLLRWISANDDFWRDWLNGSTLTTRQPSPPGEVASQTCLRRYVTCDADEGGPETWCANCRARLRSTRST